MNVTKCEGNLLQEWLTEMLRNEGKYLEPILDIRSTVLIREICNLLNQDIHVFCFAVDTLEEYITNKTSKGQEINDPALTLVSTVFVCSKYMGDQDLKIQSFLTILKKVTGHDYESKLVKLKEMDILTSLNNNLPINSSVDDLKTFITKYEKDSYIKAPILPACIEVLELLYITRSKWFFSLQKLYCINKEAMEVFKKLIRNRFFIPTGIMIYIFRKTTYINTLNVNKILEDLADGFQIHIDHLNTLVSEIEEIVKSI